MSIRTFLRQRFGILAIALTLGIGSLALACNVPVFRFALERWRPDPYRAVLFHHGPLTAADLEIIRPLEDQQAKSLANLDLRTVDVSEFNKPAAEGDEQAQRDRQLFASQQNAELPRLIVSYPDHLRIGVPVWAGGPTREAIASLLDSPARQELMKRLAEGQTAVWLLLEPADDAASVVAANEAGSVVNVIESELKKLEEELKLPELTTAPEDALLADTPLRVAFSLLRVRRDDPAEQALISMLIHSEPDLAERNDPMVFPVFGRGRALLPLIGAGISAKNIKDSAAFLVGPCSCEVKELNPGFDLLLSTDWDKRLTASGTPLPVATAAAVPTGPPVLVPIPTGAAPVTVTTPAPVAVHAFGLTALVLVGGIALVGLIVVSAVVVAAAQGNRKHEGH